MYLVLGGVLGPGGVYLVLGGVLSWGGMSGPRGVWSRGGYVVWGCVSGPGGVPGQVLPPL